MKEIMKIFCFLGIHQWEYIEQNKYKGEQVYREQSRVCKICNKKQIKTYALFDWTGFWI